MDPDSEIKGTLYGIEWAAPVYLEGRRPWEDVAGTSGAGEVDEQFPSIIDLFVHHGGLIEVAEELIQGIKAHTKEELEHWGPKRICL